eukprot:1308965-Amphidinium_carterae.2
MREKVVPNERSFNAFHISPNLEVVEANTCLHNSFGVVALCSTIPLLLQVKDKVLKRHRVGGGVWRAWVHFDLKGQVGRDNFRAAAQRFRAARDGNTAAYRRAVSVGAAAMRLAKSGIKKACANNFGPTTRMLHRMEAKQSKLALHQRLQKASELDKALDLSQQRLLHMQGTCIRWTHFEQEEQKKNLAIIHDFEATSGEEAVKWLQSQVPGLCGEYKAIPSEMGHTFAVDLSDVDTVKHVLAWASDHDPSHVAAKLEERWSEFHDMVWPQDSHASRDPVTHTKCFLAGKCLCKGENALHDSMRIALRKKLKATFTNSEKDLLTEAEVVIQFVSNGLVNAEPDPMVKRVWAHIPVVYLNPFRPTYAVVQQSHGHAEELPNGRRVVVKVGERI